MNETLSFNYKLSLYYISTDGCDFCGRNPTELFAVETPLSDEDKAMLLVIFVVIGATAIIGLLISTSSAERWMSKVASAVNLYLVLFWLGIYQLALGLFFPKFEWKQIMSLDFRVSYIWANICLTFGPILSSSFSL